MTFNEMYTAYVEAGGTKPRSSFKNKTELNVAMQPKPAVGRISRSLTKLERARLRRAAKNNPELHQPGTRWSSHDVPVEMLKIVAA